jgi:hypothetical protein
MRIRPISLALGTVAVLLLAPRDALAFRCGNKLVTEGDRAAAAASLCGPPTEVVRSSILRAPWVWRAGRAYRVPGNEIEVVVETWTYNFGPDRLMQQLRVEDGVVVEIRTLGYGYR